MEPDEGRCQVILDIRPVLVFHVPPHQPSELFRPVALDQEVAGFSFHMVQAEQAARTAANAQRNSMRAFAIAGILSRSLQVRASQS